MGKTKTKDKDKVGFFDFNNMRIQERLKKSYIMVLAFATVAAVVGVIAVFVVSTNYKSAMDNYALPQGDIGKLMQCVADCRSATRGIIGYDNQEEIVLTASGYLAIVLQHEYDHLDGKFYYDRIDKTNPHKRRMNEEIL